ncbi:MAG: glycosyltransferase family 2 protein [Bacillota bacterium]
MQNNLTILVPAYNEAPRIGPVLEVICTYVGPKRVVVIDDGSTDGTAEVSRKYPVELIELGINRGKGAALQAGIDHVGNTDYWIFIDADLINFHHGHLDELLTPLQNNDNLAMTVGVFRGGGTLTDLAHRYFDILNGQRGLRGSFINSLPNLSWCRFGVEVFISKYAASKNYAVSYPYLKKLTHHMKEAKFGFARGLLSRLQMYKECLKALFTWNKYC